MEKEKKDIVLYFNCGHSDEGGRLNPSEQDRVKNLKMIEKKLIRTSGLACSLCEKVEEVFRPIARGDRI